MNQNSFFYNLFNSEPYICRFQNLFVVPECSSVRAVPVWQRTKCVTIRMIVAKGRTRLIVLHYVIIYMFTLNIKNCRITFSAFESYSQSKSSIQKLITGYFQIFITLFMVKSNNQNHNLEILGCLRNRGMILNNISTIWWYFDINVTYNHLRQDFFFKLYGCYLQF